ncbi:S1 family peptidase [Flavobacterium silvaticum]|uniref:Trypsin-like peptidase domain-containing protein n=1 Tax=Flavobacterium silvaticum TaxID=1852020 RepID=A0A972FJ12_9FLAO|nr:serine protease [Flavobacterium silvaticum]NMH26567.1 trypsin-like peptidase domain-containing protein [Flavobacterium silvaticum]
MLQQTIQLVTILFLMSMVSERVADFLKHYLCGSPVFRIGDTITKYPEDDSKEKARTYRILKINVWCGIITATILKADLLGMLYNMTEPGKTLGWTNLDAYVKPEEATWLFNYNYLLLALGIAFTGCFISFGSKFWHDLLDLLYEIKNTKRVLADPETYRVDNMKSLQTIFKTYQSDFIKIAFTEARSKLMMLETVKAVGIRRNDAGYYFEVTVSGTSEYIEPFYQYLLDDGTPQNIPIKISVLNVAEKIRAYSINLSEKIFDLSQPADYGTLGVLVKPLDDTSKKRFILTCCHNLFDNLNALPYSNTNKLKVGSMENSLPVGIGYVSTAKIDHEIDAALIELDESSVKIINTIPKLGPPKKARKLVESDYKTARVFVYGATTGPEIKNAVEGVVTSICEDVKIWYGNNEFTIVNTIMVQGKKRQFSQPGDSGACVLDDQNNVVGLIVGGRSTASYILPIETLLLKLKVQLA